MGIADGREWELFEGMQVSVEAMGDFLAANAFNAKGTRRYSAAYIPVPDNLAAPSSDNISTQEGFGHICLHCDLRGNAG